MYVKGIAETWCASHATSFPPVVIHITDDKPTDGHSESVEHAAEALRRLETNDGSLLLFNCHVSGRPDSGVLFPASEGELPADPYAHLLFRISSPVPETLRTAAEAWEIACPPGARGMAFNANVADVVRLIQTGTPPLL